MSITPQVAVLIEYLDMVEQRKQIQEQLRQAIEREKAQAKIIFESPDYPSETILLITEYQGIMIDIPDYSFNEYKYPDSPVKIYQVQDAGAIALAQLPELQGDE